MNLTACTYISTVERRLRPQQPKGHIAERNVGEGSTDGLEEGGFVQSQTLLVNGANGPATSQSDVLGREWSKWVLVQVQERGSVG